MCDRVLVGTRQKLPRKSPLTLTQRPEVPSPIVSRASIFTGLPFFQPETAFPCVLALGWYLDTIRLPGLLNCLL